MAAIAPIWMRDSQRTFQDPEATSKDKTGTRKSGSTFHNCCCDWKHPTEHTWIVAPVRKRQAGFISLNTDHQQLQAPRGLTF